MVLSPYKNDAERLLSDLERDAQRTFVVRAPHGSGKSALLEAVRHRSRWHARLVTVAPAEVCWTNAGLMGFLAAVPIPAVRALARKLSVSDQLRPEWVASALLALLQEEVRHPLLILVDQAENLDPSSARILSFVCRRLLDSERRVVIATSAPERECPFVGVGQFIMTPPTQESLVRIVEERFRGGISADVARIVARFAELNVGQSLEVINGLVLEQRAGAAALPMPFPVRGAAADAARVVFNGLDEPTRTLLRLLASAPSTPVGVVAELPGTDPGVLAELQSSGLVVASVSDVRLANHSLRSLIYWDTPAEDRLAFHRLLDRVAPTGTGYQAWHRTHVGNSAADVRILAEAAVGAATAENLDVAIEYAESVLSVSSRDPGIAAAMSELAYALFRSAEFTLAERYLRFAENHPGDGQAEVRHASVRVGIAFLARHRSLMRMVDDVVARRVSQFPVVTIRLLLVQSFYFVERWELVEAKEVVAEAKGLAEAHNPALIPLVEVYQALVMAVSGRAVVDASPDNPFASDPTLVLARARALTYQERYDEAESLLEALRHQTSSVDRLWRETAALLVLDNDLRRGRFTSAAARAAALSDNPSEAFPLPRLLFDAFMLREQGDLDSAEERLRELRALHADADRGLTGRRFVLFADRALHQGHYRQAARAYLLAGRAAGDALPPQLDRSRPGLIEALVMSGDTERAARELDDFRALTERFPSRWSAVPLARCEALLDQGDIQSGLLAAARLGDGDDQLFELARTWTTVSVMAGSSQMRESAAAEAVALFEEIGLSEWAAGLRRRLRIPIEPPVGAESSSRLDDKQRRLVALVGQGLTNEQIARELHVSKRTVEARLTGIFRALSVHTRAELIGAMGDLG